MASDQEPVSEEEIEALREEMDTQRAEIRRALADDLGGELEGDDHGAAIRWSGHCAENPIG